MPPEWTCRHSSGTSWWTSRSSQMGAVSEDAGLDPAVCCGVPILADSGATSASLPASSAALAASCRHAGYPVREQGEHLQVVGLCLQLQVHSIARAALVLTHYEHGYIK